MCENKSVKDCKTFCRLFSEAKTKEAFYEEMCSLKKCKYYAFFDAVSCLLVEGPDVITKEQILEAIKKEWSRINGKKRLHMDKFVDAINTKHHTCGVTPSAADED